MGYTAFILFGSRIPCNMIPGTWRKSRLKAFRYYISLGMDGNGEGTLGVGLGFRGLGHGLM